jgi:glycosyltransferase involved in cell wall biosynthesis
VEGVSIGRIGVVALRNLIVGDGGAERFCSGLVSALRAAGFDTDLVEVVGDELTFEGIEETYLQCYDLDVSAYDAVISTKAPTYLVRHPNHICYLVHTMRVFYDLWEQEIPRPSALQERQRATIHQLDTGALRPPRTRKIFSIGHEVARRLERWNSLASTVLHPALGLDGFQAGPYSDYLLLPGRLHRWKRVDLVISAMAYVEHPLRLMILGTGPEEGNLRALAAGDERIEFRGKVSDRELTELYAGALAVPFVPLREDYGYVAVEAFRSAKPVITCSDSGEPATFVRNGVNGSVCRPDAKEIGAAISHLFEHRDEARRLGEQGRNDTLHLQWPVIVSRLAAAMKGTET